jgi:hypothetical protein
MGYAGGFVGSGMFKSDANDNFSLVEGTEPAANNDLVEWAYINEIAIADGGRLWAATNTGLLQKASGDWSYAKYTDSLGTVINLEGLAYDIKIGSNGVVIAAVDGLVYVSASGSGNGFELISTGEDNMLPASGVGRVEFAFAPSNANIVYAMASTTTGQDVNSLKNVYLSEDAGATWRVVGPGGSESLNILGSFYLEGTTLKDYYQGDFNNTLVVFPNDPYKILAGGVNLWLGKKVNEEGFYQWSERSTGKNVPIYFPTYVHNDHHVYAFQPGNNNLIAIGSDGGVSIGNIQSQGYTFFSINRNYNAAQFYTVGITDQADRVLGGTQDNGTPLIDGNSTSPMSGGDVWNFGDPSLPDGGDGGFCVMSNIRSITAGVEIPPAIFYSKGPNPEGGILTDRMRRSETLGADFNSSFLSEDVSNSNFLTPMVLWESYSNENSRDSVDFGAVQDYTAGTNVLVHSKNYNQPFDYTLPVDMNEGDTIRVKDIISTKLFIATTDEIWMTFDAIQFGVVPEWFNISAENKNGFEGDPQSIAYSADANYVFVGSTEGRLFRISNIALAYDFDRADVSSANCIIATDELMIDEDMTQVITSISVDPLDANKVLVTLGNYGNSNYVYYTENALSDNPDFVSVQGNLPQMPVYASILEMHTDDAAVIGTEEGIWVSDDVSSGEWYQSSLNLGNVPVFALKQQTFYKANVTITHVDPVTGVFYEVYPAIENYGMIYAATHGRGIFREESFKEVGIDNPVIVKNNISEIKIYPNPVVNTANLTFKTDQAKDVEIDIFDINGRQLGTYQYNNINTGSNTITLDVKNFTKGTYIVKLNDGSRILTSKFIVVK